MEHDYLPHPERRYEQVHDPNCGGCLLRDRVRMHRSLVLRSLWASMLLLPIVWAVALLTGHGALVETWPAALAAAPAVDVAAPSYYCWRFLPRHPLLMTRTVRRWAARHAPW